MTVIWNEMRIWISRFENIWFEIELIYNIYNNLLITATTIHISIWNIDEQPLKQRKNNKVNN